jgi:hypothetical protein
MRMATLLIARLPKPRRALQTNRGMNAKLVGCLKMKGSAQFER